MSINKTAIILLALSSPAYAGQAEKFPETVARIQVLAKETLAAKYAVRWCIGEKIKMNDDVMGRKWNLPTMLQQDEFNQIIEASMIETRTKLDEKVSQYGLDYVCKATVKILQSGPRNEWPIIKSN